jgi:hypothetical protein
VTKQKQGKHKPKKYEIKENKPTADKLKMHKVLKTKKKRNVSIEELNETENNHYRE